MQADSKAPIVYRGMTRPALDAAYNNSNAVADSQDYIARWRERSACVRAQPNAKLDLVYGKRPRNRLDYFSCGRSGAPLFVFIHGGYWQRNEKEAFAFVAEGPLPHGIDVATIGYTLGPDARLAEIVAECHAALTYLAAHAGKLGFDAGRLFVGGWSAGGHLTAATASHPAFRGGLPISGIFELEPIALNYLNEKLSLSAAEIAALSPLRHLSDGMPPLRLAVGGDELPELRRQSQDYSQAARARGLPVQLTVLPGFNHFSVLEELARPDGALVAELNALIAATPVYCNSNRTPALPVCIRGV
jgi:arylformamidase